VDYCSPTVHLRHAPNGAKLSDPSARVGTIKIKKGVKMFNLLNDTQYICCFCESEMSADQMFCCDTYKGKMTVDEFNEFYG
jgi:hypothetical protein